MNLVDRVIWQIETKRHTPLNLLALADLCAVSPYHLARAFRGRAGLAPMAYLRARRLSVAAQDLADGRADILSVALDAQYGSHEAFSRAFQAHFGITPSDVRTQRSTQSLTLTEPLAMTQSAIIPIDPPRIEDQGAFRVSGLSMRCKNHDPSGIPALWQRLNARDTTEFNDVEAAYGVCFDGDESGFSYLAGYNSTAAAPKDMDSVDLPAGRYAIFTHAGHIADLPNFVYSVWNSALEANNLTHRKAPDFELYDKRFDVSTGRGLVEIWIPVEA